MTYFQLTQGEKDVIKALSIGKVVVVYSCNDDAWGAPYDFQDFDTFSGAFKFLNVCSEAGRTVFIMET